MAKCPVCKENYKATDDSCPNCGFDQIKKEFINQDELMRWMEETVLPCQKIYKVMTLKLKESMETPTKGTLPPKKSGWNYDAIVAHPNSFTASCYNETKCEVSNIECSKEDDWDWVLFQFLAKKTHDAHGKHGTSEIGFSYKVKDSRGVVIKNDYWTERGLSVGDVFEGCFRVYYLPESGCSIEFYDYRSE